MQLTKQYLSDVDSRIIVENAIINCPFWLSLSFWLQCLLYIWLIAALPGPPGPPGATGYTGASGGVGATGSQG